MRKTYSDVIRIKDFKDRFEYLKLDGIGIGTPTFEHLRYLNQRLYASPEWKGLRRRVIIRDDGYDLAHRDHPIPGRVIIHHIVPISIEMIKNKDPLIFDMENLICVSHDTHNAIHYGSYETINKEWHERTPNDTCPWLM